jgi:signal transduction histidine kinase
MCEEAFRCKEITQRLLSLARGSAGDAPKPVCLAAIAREVAGTIGALGDFADRTVTVGAEETAGRPAAYTVAANDAELKQVVLNLVINALQAVRPATGRVAVTLRRADDATVELEVADNGRGMTPDALERVFEPFYTDRRGDARGGGSGGAGGERGTGLGLAITHSIVADHGGTIRAESGGPGRGSRFVVRLPAAPTGAPSTTAAATSARNADGGGGVARA